MKRLYYTTSTLDDAHAISDEVHSLGIDDHHFYVVSRDEQGIQTHQLHGSKSLDNTELLSAKKRAWFFASLPMLVFLAAIIMTIDNPMENFGSLFVLGIAIFAACRFISGLACNSFDDYLRGVFDDRLDSGDTLVVIDVPRDKADRVSQQLAGHELARFVADSSNIASPIPQ